MSYRRASDTLPGMWWELEGNDGFVNARQVTGLLTIQDGGTWKLRPTPGFTSSLKGTYASEADAQDQARKLTQGVDPSSIV
jgi:hypothetical protein